MSTRKRRPSDKKPPLVMCNCCGVQDVKGGELRLRPGSVCDFCGEGVLGEVDE